MSWERVTVWMLTCPQQQVQGQVPSQGQGKVQV